jgi:predicted MFS family arabinose efflux permease
MAGIIGSVMIGKILDKHKNYKRMQIYVALGSAITVFLTMISLKYGAPYWISIIITILGGVPLSSVSVVSYQF